MRIRDFSIWMWNQALAVPAVDVVESGGVLQVHVALPGVDAASITIGLDPAGLSVSALRPFPCRGEQAQIHRIEIPYGRFKRHIGLPLGDPRAPLELAGKSLDNGVLTLTFRRKAGA